MSLNDFRVFVLLLGVIGPDCARGAGSLSNTKRQDRKKTVAKNETDSDFSLRWLDCFVYRPITCRV